MDWIFVFWNWTFFASNRIRSEIFFAETALDWFWSLCLLHKCCCLLAWYVFMRSQIGVGLLVSCWYRIRSGFGLKICKTGLEPDSKTLESAHLYIALLVFSLFVSIFQFRMMRHSVVANSQWCKHALLKCFLAALPVLSLLGILSLDWNFWVLLGIF